MLSFPLDSMRKSSINVHDFERISTWNLSKWIEIEINPSENKELYFYMRVEFHLRNKN